MSVSVGDWDEEGGESCHPTIANYVRLPNPGLDEFVGDSLHPLYIGMHVIGEDVCELDPPCAVHEVSADTALG